MRAHEKVCRVLGEAPVIPNTWDDEAKESLEPSSSKPAWAPSLEQGVTASKKEKRKCGEWVGVGERKAVAIINNPGVRQPRDKERTKRSQKKDWQGALTAWRQG